MNIRSLFRVLGATLLIPLLLQLADLSTAVSSQQDELIKASELGEQLVKLGRFHHIQIVYQSDMQTSELLFSAI
jgi:hypothetical protein